MPSDREDSGKPGAGDPLARFEEGGGSRISGPSPTRPGKDAAGSADIGTNHIHISSGTSESLDTGLMRSPPRAKMKGTYHRLAVEGHDHADRSTNCVPYVRRCEKRPVLIESRGMVAQGPVRRAEAAWSDRRRRDRREGLARAHLLRLSEAWRPHRALPFRGSRRRRPSALAVGLRAAPGLCRRARHAPGATARTEAGLPQRLFDAPAGEAIARRGGARR